MKEIDDNRLTERVARGDRAAFSELYRRYRDRVYGFAYRMTGSQAIAEDITHEAFLVLIERPERYSPTRATVLTFLCAIARYQILNHLRREGRQTEDEFDSQTELVESLSEAEPDPLKVLLEQELAAEIAAAVAALPALQREALTLRQYQELSYEEIATVTGSDVNVIKVRLHRARRALARRLAPYFARKEGKCHEMC